MVTTLPERFLIVEHPPYWELGLVCGKVLVHSRWLVVSERVRLVFRLLAKEGSDVGWV